MTTTVTSGQTTDVRTRMEETRAFVRGLMEKKVKPEWLRTMDAEGRTPDEIVEVFAEHGLLGLTVPGDFGGAGLGLAEYCAAQEAVSRSHPVLSILLSSTGGLAPTAINRFGTPEQKEKYLPPLTTGQSRTSFALTEAEAGSDAAAITTRAERTADGWRINGSKQFISGAESADLFLVIASTDPAKRGRGLSAFLVGRDTPGFQVTRIDHAFGSPAWTLAELRFDDCVVPQESLLGELGQGLKVALSSLNEGRLSVASICLGGASYLVEAAAEHAKARTTFGAPPASRQAIRFMLADSVTEIAAARALIRATIEDIEHGAQAPANASAAKLFSSEMAGRVADRAVQIFGANGVTSDSVIGRIFRDLRVFRIGEGASEVQRMVIAKELLGKEVA